MNSLIVTKSSDLLKAISLLAFIWIVNYTGPAVTAQNLLNTPSEFFGFTPGDEGMLFDYNQMMEYLNLLDQNSGRMEIRQIGISPLGKAMYCVFISSESNIKNLDQLAGINKELALNPQIPDGQRNEYFNSGKVFFLATLSMHSMEVGPTQSYPLIAYDLVTTADPEKLEWLDNVVYMAVPSHNPDGMDMVVNHYRKYKGTKYEISNLPGVYHKYIGHDNNRDFVALTQTDTKAISKLTSIEWFPQVMFEKHQFTSTGPRYFVPPNHDPIAENIDAILWNWTGIFGSNLTTDFTREGLSGVVQQYAFDNYWPGSTETCLWKNVAAMLTEAANAKIASSVFIEANEQKVNGKGLSDYKKSTNMPLPWPGGWWKLSDIVKYEIVSTFSILETCSDYRKPILELRNQLCRDEVKRGLNQAPYYYILPAEQHDQSEWFELARLMQEHGVEVYTLKNNFILNNFTYSAGSMIIPLAQPFRPFIKEVMEKQVYPVRRYTPNGEIIKPYDITSWSLPLHKGLTCFEINDYHPQNLPAMVKWDSDQVKPAVKTIEGKSELAGILPCSNNASYRLVFQLLSSGKTVFRMKTDDEAAQTYKKGDFVVLFSGQMELEELKSRMLENNIAGKFVAKPGEEQFETIKLNRIALLELWTQDTDAGWTRFIMDYYGIPFTVLRPEEFEKFDLEKHFDVLILPDNPKDLILTGKYKNALGEVIPSSLPPQYAKGIGDKGFQKILGFLDKGGIILAMEQASALFEGLLKLGMDDPNSEEFMLPFKNISPDLLKKGFDCPGSFLSVNLLKDHPLTLGMPSTTGAFFREATIFSTTLPGFDTDRRVIGYFPEENILQSGYAASEGLAGGKVNMIWLRKGKGQLIVFGFNPIFRASTPATYKLFFNSVLLDRLQ